MRLIAIRPQYPANQLLRAGEHSCSLIKWNWTPLAFCWTLEIHPGMIWMRLTSTVLRSSNMTQHEDWLASSRSIAKPNPPHAFLFFVCVFLSLQIVHMNGIPPAHPPIQKQFQFWSHVVRPVPTQYLGWGKPSMSCRTCSNWQPIQSSAISSSSLPPESLGFNWKDNRWKKAK